MLDMTAEREGISTPWTTSCLQQNRENDQLKA